MLGAPPFEDLVVIIEPNRKLKVVHVLAGLDLSEERRMNLQIPCCVVELLVNDAIEIEIFH
jgi:hypothetical protein